MEISDRISRLSIPDIRARKENGGKLACLTAYTAPMARLIDPHIDIILVGDSLGMVIYGLDNTLSVTLDMMTAHGTAVVRNTRQACVVVDMPFGSYQESPSIAFRNAARLMRETGCCAIKMEGGVEMAETVAFLSQRHIPVMGHVGLMPQGVWQTGGYRARGQTTDEANQILDDARAIARAGAFALVVEGVWEDCARRITESIDIPVIGIGASPSCDGQILVSEDMLGLHRQHIPKFVRHYAHLADDIETSVLCYVDDVRKGRFPQADHCFGATKNTSVTTPIRHQKATLSQSS